MTSACVVHPQHLVWHVALVDPTMGETAQVRVSSMRGNNTVVDVCEQLNIIVNVLSHK